ncbi:MAG: transposase [Shinella sp.]|nr:transposase [Shinella sp.]
MPGIGAVVALTFRSAADDPARFSSSKKVGPWVGLTPSRNQSGERDVIGGITRAGDANLRRALCQAATVMIHRGRSTWLRSWAAQVAKRRGAGACDGGFGKAHRHHPSPDVEGWY